MKNILFTLALLISFTSVSSQCNLTLRSISSSSKLLKGTPSKLNDIKTKLSIQRIKLEKTFDIEFKLKYYSEDVAFASPNCKNSSEKISAFDKVALVLSDAVNATATSCDGTIGLGVNLLTKLHNQNKEGGYWMILSILSHEAAHIFQYKNKIKFKNTVQQEIHADFIAGWYMGKLMKDYEGKYDFSNGASKAYNEMYDKRQSISEWKQNLRMYFGSLGDNNYTSIYHHGNFTTRYMAIHYGMKSYTGWAGPISITDGKSRDYKKLLATYGKRDASTFIERYNY